MACSVMYLVTYTHFIHNGSAGVVVTPPLIWQNVLLSYSLMSATIPCLKGFMKGFTTGGMGCTNTGTLEGSRSGGAGGSNNYQRYSVKAKAAATLGGLSSMITSVQASEDPYSNVMRRRKDANEHGSVNSQES